MSVVELDRSVSRPVSGSLFALGRLARNLRLVAGAAAPVAALTAVLWGLAYVAYQQDSRAGRPADIDTAIVQEQLRRAVESPPADLAFVGDSSCLFGIDPSSLRERFPGRSIENFCTTGWVGPAGYGSQITQMARHGTLPKNLVIYLHPIQFSRHPSWDQWTETVKRGLPAARGPIDLSPVAALDYARETWLEPMLYRPLPGAHALYYGSFAAIMQSMKDGHGILVNSMAYKANDLTTLDKVKRVYRGWRSEPPVSYGFATTEAYDRAFADLSKSLENMDKSHVFLLMAPVTMPLDDRSLAERNRTAERLTAELGLPAGNLIRSPVSLPWFLFSDSAHPTRWGSVVLTQKLADYLPPL